MYIHLADDIVVLLGVGGIPHPVRHVETVFLQPPTGFLNRAVVCSLGEGKGPLECQDNVPGRASDWLLYAQFVPVAIRGASASAQIVRIPAHEEVAVPPIRSLEITN